MTRTCHHIFCCVCLFSCLLYLLYLLFCFSCFFSGSGFVFVFNDEIHLGRGSSHNFRGNLQVVFSKSLRKWVSFGCPLHVVLSVAIMVFPDHLFHSVGGRAGKHGVERWEFLGVGLVRKKRRRRSRILPCPLDHFRYGIFPSAAYALGGRSHHQKGGMA